MNKITPGPWTADELTCEDHRGMGWIRGDGKDIAAYGDSAMWIEQNRANGKAIAAVPDLIEALQRSLNWLSSYPGGNAVGCYDQARAALRKAGVE